MERLNLNLVKKLSSLLVILPILFSCGTPSISFDPIEVPNFTSRNQKLLKYIPNCEEVYEESAAFFLGEKKQLMYDIKSITSITSYDGSITYTPDVDYALDEDNLLYLLEGTSIPYFTEKTYYPSSGIYKCNDGIHDYIYYNEGKPVTNHQVLVTYKSVYKKYTFASNHMSSYPVLKQRLEDGDYLRFLFYGDSVMVGANGSGYLSYPPNNPSIDEYFGMGLLNDYPKANFEIYNTSVGGKSSYEAYNMLEERCIDIKPNIIFWGFGTNDSPYIDRELVDITKQSIEKIHASLPNAVVVLISPLRINPEAKDFYTSTCEQMEDIYSEAASSYDYVDLISMNKLHEEILQRKEFIDMSANNINHPNDFLIRLYAMNLLRYFGVII